MLLDVGGAFLGAMLGVFGTHIIARLFAPSERLEGRRDQILSNAISVLDDIEQSSLKYWNAEISENSAEFTMVQGTLPAKLHELLQICNELFKNHQDSQKYTDEEIKELRILTTGDTFGEQVTTPDVERIQRLRTSVGTLRRSLNRRRSLLRRTWFTTDL